MSSLETMWKQGIRQSTITFSLPFDLVLFLTNMFFTLLGACQSKEIWWKVPSAPLRNRKSLVLSLHHLSAVAHSSDTKSSGSPIVVDESKGRCQSVSVRNLITYSSEENSVKVLMNSIVKRVWKKQGSVNLNAFLPVNQRKLFDILWIESPGLAAMSKAKIKWLQAEWSQMIPARTNKKTNIKLDQRF